jgi:uncharacterized protein (TIGR02145 family)
MKKVFFLPVFIIAFSVIMIACSDDDDSGNNPTNTGTVPELTTAAVSILTETTAACGGEITSDGGASITARGVCWGTTSPPTISDSTTNDGTGTGSFTSNITNLTKLTTYYIRAYATNSAGTGYGDVDSFKAGTDTVSDIDGNIYETVIIGTQWWMAENLKVTKYRNGEDIPKVTDGPTWAGLSTGAYCEYGNDTGNVATYGRLYNWFAIDDSRKIAPTGWHVPTESEIQALYNYLGGKLVAGGKLKEIGTTHWVSPNDGATNETGFTGLPGGARDSDGSFIYLYNYGDFWSATEYDVPRAWLLSLWTGYEGLYDYGYSKLTGCAVRCVKD